jgi:hypothetical protein
MNCQHTGEGSRLGTEEKRNQRARQKRIEGQMCFSRCIDLTFAAVEIPQNRTSSVQWRLSLGFTFEVGEAESTGLRRGDQTGLSLAAESAGPASALRSIVFTTPSD